MRRLVAILLAVLPATAYAGPPTRAEIQRELRRLVGRHADAEACRITHRDGTLTTLECTTRRCGPACRVTHIYTTLVFRDGQASVTARRERRVGDTGECGCCILHE